MPHNSEDVINFAMREHAEMYEKIRSLQRDNNELKVLLIDVVRQMKEIEVTLLRAIDKDRS